MVDISEGIVHYRPLPPARDLRGAASFTPNALTIKVTEGRADRLRLSDADMVFSALDTDTPRAAIATNVTGPVKGVLNLLDHPTLGVATAAGLPPENGDGQVSGRLRVNFPMRGNLAFGDIETVFEGDVTDGSLAGVAAGQDLEDPMMKVVLRGQELTVRGRATIQGQTVVTSPRNAGAPAACRACARP